MSLKSKIMVLTAITILYNGIRGCSEREANSTEIYKQEQSEVYNNERNIEYMVQPQHEQPEYRTNR